MRLRLGIATVVVAVLALPASAANAPGTLDYRQTFTKGPPWVEGQVSYVRVRDARGDAVVSRRVQHRPSFRLVRKLSPGRYRVISYQRPCDGSCNHLDPPAARCSRRIRILSGGLTDVRTTVRPGARHCRMTPHAYAKRFPPAARIRAVQRYLSTRSGINSWALIDNWGRVRGFAPQRVYVTASVVKAMLLTAYLRRLGNHMPSTGDRAVLNPMITVSSNEAADAIYSRLGDAPLYDLAKRAGMTHFSVAGYWANAHFSAEDQARFFNKIDRLIPKASRGYARTLLSSIVSSQRWGFSRFSLARGFKTFFKGGWRGTGAGQLVHEVALFERGPLRISMAVLTDGNPSQAYGQETLRGVAQRIFGSAAAHSAQAEEEPPERPKEGGTRATRRAGLVDVHRFAPSIRVNLSYRTKHNETGAPLPGYCKNWGMLHERAAFNLGQVQRYLRRKGLSLLILDAYRPVRATEALVRWAERTGRGGAVGTYIARRSRHNTGSAVDITLVRDRDGKRLRMGGFAFGPSSHTYNAGGKILRNRLTLKNAMERFGFGAYLNEWWHFEHYIRPNRYLDVTLGC